MNTALKISEPADRPGWIPPDIFYDWDTNPYAYQTEKELMPAGGLHGQILAYITEILRDFLESRGLMFLADTFMLYRDSSGIKQRVSPDLLIIPLRSEPPSAYNSDTEPPPRAVAEITSPESHLRDMEDKVSFYMNLGIPAYLVIDAVTPHGLRRQQIGLHLWRKIRGRIIRIMPDRDRYLSVPEMGLKVTAQGQRLIFADIVTGEILLDTGQLRKSVSIAEQTAAEERRRADMAEKEAELIRNRAEKLAEKLRALGIDPDDIGENL